MDTYINQIKILIIYLVSKSNIENALENLGNPTQTNKRASRLLDAMVSSEINEFSRKISIE